MPDKPAAHILGAIDDKVVCDTIFRSDAPFEDSFTELCDRLLDVAWQYGSVYLGDEEITSGSQLWQIVEGEHGGGFYNVIEGLSGDDPDDTFAVHLFFSHQVQKLTNKKGLPELEASARAYCEEEGIETFDKPDPIDVYEWMQTPEYTSDKLMGNSCYSINSLRDEYGVDYVNAAIPEAMDIMEEKADELGDGLCAWIRHRFLDHNGDFNDKSFTVKTENVGEGAYEIYIDVIDDGGCSVSRGERMLMAEFPYSNRDYVITIAKLIKELFHNLAWDMVYGIVEYEY